MVQSIWNLIEYLKRPSKYLCKHREFFILFFKIKKSHPKKKVEKKVKILTFFKIRVGKTIMKFENFSLCRHRYWNEVTSDKNSSFSNKRLHTSADARFYVRKMAIWGRAPPFLGRGKNLIFFSRSAIFSSFTWYKSHFCISNRYF